MKYRITLLLIIFIFCINCKTTKFINSCKNGDLIFVEAAKDHLSGAISRVTTDKNKTISFDHIALVEVEKKKKYILHAYPSKGSVKEDLKCFVKKYHIKKLALSNYRLKKEYISCIPKAILNANTLLGKPYNFLYILNNDSLYCSDYIEKSFRNCSIFQLQPMTFIDPKTGKTDYFWQQFYASKNTSIPEGKLGSNPNGLSKSDKIYLTRILK